MEPPARRYRPAMSDSQLLALTPQCFPDTQVTRDIASVAEPVTRASLGVFGCLVGALTIER